MLGRKRRASWSPSERSPSPRPLTLAEAVCADWANTHDASARVVFTPAPAVALRLRGHDAVLELPGTSANDEEGVVLRLRRACAVAAEPPLLDCCALLTGDFALLVDVRDSAEDDDASRWVQAAQALLGVELPARFNATQRLFVVLEALWDAADAATLVQLFAVAAAAAAAAAADAAAAALAARNAAQAGRGSGDDLEEVLRVVLVHARDAFAVPDILACRAACRSWCRAASNPDCYMRLELPAGATAAHLRAWLRLAVGDCGSWTRQKAELPASVRSDTSPKPALGVQMLDLVACESIAYGDLLPVAQSMATTLTALRLRRIMITARVELRPGVHLLTSAMLQGLVAAAPKLKDIAIPRINTHQAHELAVLSRAFSAWAAAEGARGVALRLGELVIDARRLRGGGGRYGIHRSGHPYYYSVPRTVVHVANELFGGPRALANAVRDLPPATRVLLRLPAELGEEVLDADPGANWRHLQGRVPANDLDPRELRNACRLLYACVEELRAEARVTVEMVA